MAAFSITAILAGVAHLAVITHHRAPTGVFLAVLIVLALLYVGLRTGRLGRLLGRADAARLRGELRGLRIRPAAFIPMTLLVIVVAVLLISRR